MADPMPSLLIAAGTVVPPLPSPTDPAVTVWCDSRGTPGALSHVVNQEPWLHVLKVASFRLDLEQNAVVAVPCPTASPEAIVDEWQSAVWPAFLQMKGHEALHASAVATRTGVVIFCAASESGKSTLAYALSQRGYPQWADDAVVLAFTSDDVRAVPLPYHIRLRHASALHFGYLRRQVNRGRVRRAGAHHLTAERISAICLLDGTATDADAPAAAIHPVAAATGLTRVLEHAVYFGLQDHARKRLMLEHYLSLVTRVPLWHVRFQRGLHLLPSVIDALEEQLLCVPAR
jgi:hypothetical protein